MWKVGDSSAYGLPPMLHPVTASRATDDPAVKVNQTLARTDGNRLGQYACPPQVP